MEAALSAFVGEIEQVPPMYSAVWKDGRRLYDLARQGIEVERERRPVTIHSLELTAAQPQENRYTIEVNCSKGTYIRTVSYTHLDVYKRQDIDSSQQIQWNISKIFLVHCERMGYNRFRDRGASGEPAPHSVSP